jgi:hypothetical protein
LRDGQCFDRVSAELDHLTGLAFTALAPVANAALLMPAAR